MRLCCSSTLGVLTDCLGLLGSEAVACTGYGCYLYVVGCDSDYTEVGCCVLSVSG